VLIKAFDIRVILLSSSYFLLIFLKFIGVLVVSRNLILISFTLLFYSCVSAETQWKSLFDGKSIKGWSTKVEGDVKAVDGEIQILTKKNLWLVTDAQFSDFELEAEVLMPTDSYNSGIGFRIDNSGKKPMGYQCEVADAKTGSVYAIGKGWVLPKSKNDWAGFYAKAGDCFKKEKWNKIRIVCKGKRIQIWVNGHQTVDIEDDKFTKGGIALQHHGKGAVHRFRNIRVREL